MNQEEQPKPKIRLKPVVYTTSHVKRGAPNNAQQIFLLKALQVTQDPQKLKQMIGVKTVAEVYRTLDKMALRKEFHHALDKAGISFDFIVGGIKDIAQTGFKDADRLKAYQTLLKSVGMDTYREESASGTGTWEEVLLQKIEETKAVGPGGESKPIQLEEYAVTEPIVPESARLAQEAEEETTGSVYDTKPEEKK